MPAASQATAIDASSPNEYSSGASAIVNPGTGVEQWSPGDFLAAAGHSAATQIADSLPGWLSSAIAQAQQTESAEATPGEYSAGAVAVVDPGTGSELWAPGGAATETIASAASAVEVESSGALASSYASVAGTASDAVAPGEFVPAVFVLITVHTATQLETPGDYSQVVVVVGAFVLCGKQNTFNVAPGVTTLKV